MSTALPFLQLHIKLEDSKAPQIQADESYLLILCE